MYLHLFFHIRQSKEAMSCAGSIKKAVLTHHWECPTMEEFSLLQHFFEYACFTTLSPTDNRSSNEKCSKQCGQTSSLRYFSFSFSDLLSCLIWYSLRMAACLSAVSYTHLRFPAAVDADHQNNRRTIFIFMEILVLNTGIQFMHNLNQTLTDLSLIHI